MTLFHNLKYAPAAAEGLCRTCTWGTVRKGFLSGEAEAFCRLIGPNSRVRYAVSDCSGYHDRRPPAPAPAPAANGASRRYGFVTEIKLEDGSKVQVGSNKNSAKPRDK